MKNYDKILLALELNSSANELLLNRAVKLAEKFKAKITVLHVIEDISDYGGMYGVLVRDDLKERLQNKAAEKLEKITAKFAIEKKDLLIVTGSVSISILEIAKSLQADLIIVGSHARHGVKLLLGSTANAVLHQATCDVLAVRIR